METKSPAFQWYPKQFLGDDKVLAMDWDAVGMHVWLLNISWQQEPRGSLPNDLPLIRRWLRSPSDEIWRRVSPQLMSAWTLAGDRLVNAGIQRAAQKQAIRSQVNTNNVRTRYETPTKMPAEEDVGKRVKEGDGKPLGPDDQLIAVWAVPPSAGELTNHPSKAAVLAYCLAHAELKKYTAEQVGRAFNFFETTAVNGFWYLGKRLVGDWRVAIEFKLGEMFPSDDKAKANPNSDFFRYSKELELVEKEIKTIKDRALVTATDTVIREADKEPYAKLIERRKELKKLLNLR